MQILFFRDRSPTCKLEAHRNHWWEHLINREVYRAGASQTESVPGMEEAADALPEWLWCSHKSENHCHLSLQGKVSLELHRRLGNGFIIIHNSESFCLHYNCKSAKLWHDLLSWNELSPNFHFYVGKLCINNNSSHLFLVIFTWYVKKWWWLFQ